MNDQHAEKLAKAVHHWLEFQIICGRKMLLSESYLAQPVGECLSTFHSGSIAAEWVHPNFVNSGVKGRPKQVDYALFGRDNGIPTAAIEAKWVGERKAQKQRIVDDIMRLDCIRNSANQGMVRYFLVAGEKSNFTNNLMSLQVQSDGVRSNFMGEVLPKDKKVRKNYQVVNCKNAMRKFYIKFSNDYGIEVPKSYDAEKIEDINPQHGATRVAIWKISSASRRSTFQPSATWQD